MPAFDFRGFARLPHLDPARMPFRLEVRDFRRYTAYVDLAKLLTKSPTRIGPVNLSNATQFEVLNNLFIELIRRDRVKQVAACAILDKHGVVARMDEFRSHRPRDAYEPDFIDLLILYSYIRAEKPRRILELGSGLSTVVMAHALQQNGEGSLVSAEASGKWAAATAESMPADLRRYATVEHFRSEPCEVRGQQSVRFTDLPDDFDMAYVDGAPPGAHFGGAESLPDPKPGTAVFVDARYRSVDYLNGETCGWSLSIREATTGGPIGFPLGLDQFANAMVKIHG